MSRTTSDRVEGSHLMPKEGSPLQLVIGFLAFVMGLFYLYSALNIRTPPIGDVLGPRFFPLVLGGLFVLFCLANIVVDFVSPQEPEDQKLSADVKLRTAGVFLVSVLYIAALPYLGYIVSTLLLIASFLTVVRFGRFVRPAGWALVLTGAFYLLFEVWLGVHLPIFNF